MIYTFTKKSDKQFVRKVYKDQEEFLFERRRLRIKQARVEFPDERDINKAYWLYCQEHKLEYIPLEYVHEYAAERQRVRKKEWEDKYIKCMDCGQVTVSVDPLCHTLQKYKEGYKSILFCSNCLATTLSKYPPLEVLKHG